MFASLFFPEAKNCTEFPISVNPDLFTTTFDTLGFTEEERKDFLDRIHRGSDDPAVLTYRAQLQAEIFASAPLREILEAFSRFCALCSRAREYVTGTTPDDALRMLTLFEGLSGLLGAFLKKLDTFVPESAAAKRLWLFCRAYAASFEYRELKTKAADLRRELCMENGYTLNVGDPLAPARTLTLKKDATPAEGIFALTQRMTESFTGEKEPAEPAPNRPYTEQEAHLIVRYLQADPKRCRKAEEFAALYLASDTDTLLRLGKEAAFYLSADKYYRHFSVQGLPLCVPSFTQEREFFLEQLQYSTAAGMGKTDVALDDNVRLGVVFGPDSAAMTDAVHRAAIMGCWGGLIFAHRARIPLLKELREDKNGNLSSKNLDAGCFCICGHLFDTLLPRQEEVAAEAVINRLAATGAYGWLRICSRNNLDSLRRKCSAKDLPACRITEAGTDYTLDDLLKNRHRERSGENHEK